MLPCRAGRLTCDGAQMPSIEAGAMLGDLPRDLKARPPEPATREGRTVEQARHGLDLRLQRTSNPRLARDQLAVLVEIHRAAAGHLDRKGLFTAIAKALQGVIPVSRVILQLPGADPSALTVYAASGKSGLQ